MLGMPDTPPPDLLVSDVVLPGPMGPRLASCLRARYPDLPVLLMSGCSDPQLLAESLADDSIAFLPKPFAPAELLAVVHALLDEKRARQTEDAPATRRPCAEATAPGR